MIYTLISVDIDKERESADFTFSYRSSDGEHEVRVPGVKLSPQKSTDPNNWLTSVLRRVSAKLSRTDDLVKYGEVELEESDYLSSNRSLIELYASAHNLEVTDIHYEDNNKPRATIHGTPWKLYPILPKAETPNFPPAEPNGWETEVLQATEVEHSANVQALNNDDTFVSEDREHATDAYSTVSNDWVKPDSEGENTTRKGIAIVAILLVALFVLWQFLKEDSGSTIDETERYYQRRANFIQGAVKKFDNSYGGSEIDQVTTLDYHRERVKEQARDIYLEFADPTVRQQQVQEVIKYRVEQMRLNCECDVFYQHQ